MEKKKKTEIQTSCDTCAYLIYDEEYEEYVCDVSMDEDEIAYIALHIGGNLETYENQKDKLGWYPFVSPVLRYGGYYDGEDCRQLLGGSGDQDSGDKAV